MATSSPSILEILQRALYIEYRFIVHYPRLADCLLNEGDCKALRWIGEQSMRHSEVVSLIIRRLGGQPVYEFEPLEAEQDILHMLGHQLELEKAARFLYRQAPSVAPPEIREEIWRIAVDERTTSRL